MTFKKFKWDDDVLFKMFKILWLNQNCQCLKHINVNSLFQEIGIRICCICECQEEVLHGAQCTSYSQNKGKHQAAVMKNVQSLVKSDKCETQ